MPYSLDELAKDIKGILKDDGIQEGSDKVCYYVQKALMDQNFIQNNLFQNIITQVSFLS